MLQLSAIYYWRQQFSVVVAKHSITSCAARWPPQYATAPWPWLLTLKSVWESHVTWGTPVQSFVFLGLLVFELEPMYATSDRQTDADDRLMPPLTGRGHNKCIEDDTKAATRQSPNCIKKTKIIKYSKKRFSIWRMEFLHPAIWHDHDIDFARWLHSAMQNVALRSWQWIHQVAVPQ